MAMAQRTRGTILPLKRWKKHCHKVPIWARERGLNGYLDNAHFNPDSFDTRFPYNRTTSTMLSARRSVVSLVAWLKSPVQEEDTSTSISSEVSLAKDVADSVLKTDKVLKTVLPCPPPCGPLVPRLILDLLLLGICHFLGKLARASWSFGGKSVTDPWFRRLWFFANLYLLLFTLGFLSFGHCILSLHYILHLNFLVKCASPSSSPALLPHSRNQVANL